MKVGSKEYQALPIAKKIALLVRRGYKQAAFRTKSNAIAFANAWKRKGYAVEGSRSTGPTIEDESKITAHAYFVTARKVRGKKR